MCKETSWRYITWTKLHVRIQREKDGNEIDYGNALHAVRSAELAAISFLAITDELADNFSNRFGSAEFVRNISRDCRPLSREPQYIKLYLLPSPIAENADFECEVSAINFWPVLGFTVRL